MDLSRREFVAATVAAVSAYGAAAPPAGRFSRFDPQVRKLLATLSLDQKIGQMTQPDQMFLHSEDDIVKYHLGSLLSGGDSDPKSGNDLQSWTDLYDHYQSIALKAEPRIPLLYGIDAVHGHNNVLGATIFPHDIGLGCTRDAKLVENIARITAEEVRATGINWAFAPCVTVPQDIRWGRTYEGYSESPDIVKSLGGAAVRGLQRDALDHPLAVLACAKHFAGDGGTTFGTGMPKSKGSDARYPLDRGDTRVDEATLRKIHLPGHIAAVQAGVGSIMPSYSSWNGVKCSGSRRLLTEILKQELGFEGFLISDYDALNELPGDYKEQIAQSVNAGMDMVMVPKMYIEFFGKLRELVNEGKVPMTRIDDAVTRILRVKFALGLMDATRSPLADRSVQKTFGSAEHRAVARQAVRQSLVLLKNENHLLPLAKDAKLHVAGKSADDIGNQCGGWTITWQGKSGDVIKGTTILAAIRKTGAHVTSSPDGNGTAGAAIGIAVIGETPYAEFFGDRTNLRLTVEDVVLVDTMKRAGLRVVAVVVSGRPLIIDDILDKADAIVAAWLPGTEGDGVADVLFGDSKPTGKLSFTWPSDTPKPLYALGYGLGY
jgi:beta-glucosidase